MFSTLGSHTILVYPYQTLVQYSDGDPLTGAKIAILQRPNSLLHRWLLDHRVWWTFRRWSRPIGYSTLLIAGDGRRRTTHRWILFMSGSLDVTPKTTENNLIVRNGKSEAEVTNNKRLHSKYCTVETNYWQTQSIARPLCDSRASCLVCIQEDWRLVLDKRCQTLPRLSPYYRLSSGEFNRTIPVPLLRVS